MRRVAPILAAALGLGPATIVNAQVLKPRITEPTERLPAPSKITATAGADGPIRVIWSAVDGVSEYSLIRSVPPAGAARLILPNPTDTQYVDLNVSPGKTYYYTVAALNEVGLGGMKAAATPVTAADTATTRPPAPARGVSASLYGSTAEISWSSSMNARTYQVERASITGTGTNWSRIAYGIPCCRVKDRLDSYPAGSRIFYRVSAANRTLFSSPPALSNEITIGPGGPSTDTTTGRLPKDTTTGRLPRDTTTANDSTTGRLPKDTTTGRLPRDTTTANDSTAGPLPKDTTTGRLPRDTTAVNDSTAGPLPKDTTTGRLPTDTSAAMGTNVRPAVVAPPARIKVGGSVNPGNSSTFTSLRLRNPRWLSLDPSIATVNSLGKVLGRAAGFAYIVAIGMTPDGSVGSMVQRVEVKR